MNLGLCRTLSSTSLTLLCRSGAGAAAIIGGMLIAGSGISANAADTLTASPVTFNMPPGDHGIGRLAHRRVAPRRIPIGEAALAAIKAKASSYTAEAATTIPLAAQQGSPRAV